MDSETKRRNDLLQSEKKTVRFNISSIPWKQMKEWEEKLVMYGSADKTQDNLFTGKEGTNDTHLKARVYKRAVTNALSAHNL